MSVDEPSAPTRRPSPDDGGFTLLEVVVSLSLLGVLAAAAVGASLAVLHRADVQRERQVAVAVANQGMERAHAVRATGAAVTRTADLAGATQTGGLTQGRTAAEVRAAWDAVSFPGKARSLPMWDRAASPGADAVPVTSAPTVVAGTAYSTTTLVGTCVLSGGACTAWGAGGTVLQRVVVHVAWAGCGSTCSYDAVALVDPSADQSWRVAS